MKYCKQCGVLYSSVLEACPKCGMALEPPPSQDELPQPSKRELRRQWIGILVGIPALIAFIYLIGLVFKQLGAF